MFLSTLLDGTYFKSFISFVKKSLFSQIEFKLLLPNAKMPSTSYDGDVGYDLYACLKDDLQKVYLMPNCVTKIHTGVSIMNNNKQIWSQIVSRSSLASCGLHVVGGVIDADYTGELIVMIQNTNLNLVTLNHGDKIAQLIFHKRFMPIKSNCNMSQARSDKGFGSSNK